MPEALQETPRSFRGKRYSRVEGTLVFTLLKYIKYVTITNEARLEAREEKQSGVLGVCVLGHGRSQCLGIADIRKVQHVIITMIITDGRQCERSGGKLLRLNSFLFLTYIPSLD